MRAGLAIVLLAGLVTLTGCEVFRDFTSERYSRNNSKGEAWLSDQQFPAETDVSGTWQSSDWGKCFLAQSGREVRGYMGDYQAEGVVSGNKAYLVLSQGSWQYYSVVLERPAQNLLIGYYSRSIPYQSDNRNDLRLDLLP